MPSEVSSNDKTALFERGICFLEFLPVDGVVQQRNLLLGRVAAVVVVKFLQLRTNRQAAVAVEGIKKRSVPAQETTAWYSG